MSKIFLLIISFLSWFFLIGSALAQDLSTAIPNQQLMVIADIHFNPFADCTVTAKACPEAVELNKAKASDWPAILAQYNLKKFPRTGQETNYQLFSAMLNKVQTQKPENILILGDFLAHDFYRKYLLYVKDTNKKDFQQFVLKTLQYLSYSIQKISPENTSIFPVIGNHDSYGGKGCRSPSLNYCFEENGAFFSDISRIWAPLIRNKENQKEFLATFPMAGFYEITLPNANHLLVLNTVLFSPHAQGYGVHEAANKQIAWLENRLIAYQTKHQKTWIAWHIPLGIDHYSTIISFFRKLKFFWKKNYNKTVLLLMSHYRDTIADIYSGHLHRDGFLLFDANGSTDNLIDSFVPAISPIYGNNPAYKIYDYNRQTLAWYNYTTYYFNRSWKKEYIFNKNFKSALKNRYGFSTISLDFENPFTENYLTFYNVSSDFKSFPKQARKTFWCSIHHLNIVEYQNCLSR